MLPKIHQFPFFFSWEHTSVPRGREKNSATSSPRWERLHTSRLDTFPSPPPDPYKFSIQSESQVKLPLRGGHLNGCNKLGRLFFQVFFGSHGIFLWIFGAISISNLTNNVDTWTSHFKSVELLVNCPLSHLQVSTKLEDENILREFLFWFVCIINQMCSIFVYTG